jgi:hypothetical protein
MSYDPVVDRYEIATMIVGVAAVIAAYFGARLGARRSIAAARSVNPQEWSIEHARWIRDRRSDIYIDAIAIREFRAMLRSRTLRDITSNDPELDAPSSTSAGILFARMHLWGSAKAVGLLQEAYIAEQRCVSLHAEWRASGDDARLTGPLRNDVDEALMAADIADESLIGYLREEIQQPIAPPPADGNRAASLDWPSVPGHAPAVDASEPGERLPN